MALVLAVPAKSIDPDGNINCFDQMCDNVTLKGRWFQYAELTHIIAEIALLIEFI